MPRINGRGQVVAGVGDGVVSVDGVAVARGGAACWLDDDRVVFGGPWEDRWRTLVYDTRTGLTEKLSDCPASFVVGGGLGQWGAVGAGGFAGSAPLPPETRLSLASTDGRGAADRAGTIALSDQSGIGFHLLAPHGEVTDGAPGVPAYDLTVVGPTSALWPDRRGGYATLNLPVPQVAGAPGRGCWCVVRGVPWLVAYEDGLGLVAHPAADARRGIVVEARPVFFHYDAAVVGDAIRVTYATTAAEAPGEVVVRDLDLTQLVPLVPVVDVPRVGRDLWVGWFVFGGVSHPDLPGNCECLTTDAVVRDRTGRAVAQYVAGKPEGDIAALEQAVADAKARRPGVPVLPYWTRGPQGGRVPAGADIVGVEAYRYVDETLGAFEGRIRRAVARCPRAALVCQCYTSNADLTPNVAELVPVYARVARDCPNVELLLAFSGAGRATGYQDHPEAAPPWAALWAGVTGAPSLPVPVPVPRPTPPPAPRPVPVPVPAPQPQPKEEDEMIAYGSPLQGFTPGDIEDNGNGTVSVRKSNGLYLCVTPEGRMEERPSGGGAWESFVRGKSSLKAERDGGARGLQVYVLPLVE